MTTIKDIAAAVGVSVATVSNVLNGRPNVGREIRQKVLRSAKALGYAPNRAAQSMRTGRTRAIGLVLPDLTNPFFSELAHTVAGCARAAGLLVCLIDSQGSAEGESDGFVLLAQHAVDAVIWCPAGGKLPAAARSFPRPVVLIDRPRPGYDVVHSDYRMGGRLLAEYALRMGHTRVGLISGPQHIASARQRRDGFVAAFPGRLKIAWEFQADFDGTLGAEPLAALAALAARAGDRRRTVTLIVAGNDLLAISTIRRLTADGVRVPQQISVTGFDDIRWSEVVTPRLTTIAQPIDAIGARAVERVQERMAGSPPSHRRAIFDVRLVERDSVRRLR